jgi:hypothetical protein
MNLSMLLLPLGEVPSPPSLTHWEKLLENLQSVEWWAGVVIVGILINLVSAYIKPLLDKLPAWSSFWIRRHGEKQVARYETLLNRLRESPHYQVLAAIDEMYFRFKGFLCWGLVFVLILILTARPVDASSTVLLSIMCLATICVSYSYRKQADLIRLALNATQEAGTRVPSANP